MDSPCLLFSLSSPFSCISLTLTLLQCHSKWAYRQLQGSRHRELHIARVFITLALTFTQMGRQSSFVFIFSQAPAPAPSTSRWWLRRFVIFGGPWRSQTRFTLMGQLPSPPPPQLHSIEDRRFRVQSWGEGQTVVWHILWTHCLHVKVVKLRVTVTCEHLETAVTGDSPQESDLLS